MWSHTLCLCDRRSTCITNSVQYKNSTVEKIFGSLHELTGTDSRVMHEDKSDTELGASWQNIEPVMFLKL